MPLVSTDTPSPPSPPVSPAETAAVTGSGTAAAGGGAAGTGTGGGGSTDTMGPRDFSRSPSVAVLFFVAEVFSLVAAVAILLTCAVLLLARLGWGTDGIPETEVPPMPPATYAREAGPTAPVRNEFGQLNWYSTVDSGRQRARADRRSAIYQSAAVSAGVAVGFIALMLFLRTARVWAIVATEKLSFWERAALVAPGMIALVCATVIIVFAREDRSAPPPDPRTPPPAYAAPTYVS